MLLLVWHYVDKIWVTLLNLAQLITYSSIITTSCFFFSCSLFNATVVVAILVGVIWSLCQSRFKYSDIGLYWTEALQVLQIIPLQASAPIWAFTVHIFGPTSATNCYRTSAISVTDSTHCRFGELDSGDMYSRPASYAEYDSDTLRGAAAMSYPDDMSSHLWEMVITTATCYRWRLAIKYLISLTLKYYCFWCSAGTCRNLSMPIPKTLCRLLLTVIKLRWTQCLLLAGIPAQRVAVSTRIHPRRTVLVCTAWLTACRRSPRQSSHPSVRDAETSHITICPSLSLSLSLSPTLFFSFFLFLSLSPSLPPSLPPSLSLPLSLPHSRYRRLVVDGSTCSPAQL